MSLREDFEPLRPAAFFQIGFNGRRLHSAHPFKEIKEESFRIPSSAQMLQEKSFADLHMGFNEQGLYFLCQVNQPFQDQFYPDVQRGDSLELFIDTRDLKSASYNHKFCHHFIFLPKETEGVHAYEATRFRSDDMHDLCDPQDLKVETDFSSQSYSLKIFIPAQCLYGYDPKECDRLGFNYRVNRCGGPAQHFSVSSEEFSIEQQPSLWSKVYLTDGNSPTPKPSRSRR